MGNIIWLASYPKSGNTWVRVILSNLLSKTNTPSSIDNLIIDTIASSREIIDDFSGLETSDLTNEEVLSIRPAVYTQLSKTLNEDMIFIKVHDSWKLTPHGEPLFPKEATRCVLYIIRHPLDVAASNAIHNSIGYKKALNNLMNKHYSLASKSSHIENQTEQIVSTWINHVESWTIQSSLPIHVIKYEDLVDDTFGTIKRAIQFAGLDYNDKEIEIAVKNSEFDILKAQENTSGFKEKPINTKSFFRTGKPGNWKGIYKINDFELIVGDQAEMVAKFGYP